MSKTTREQMCADLALAMFPTAVIELSSSGNGVDIRVYDKPNETRSWYDFNPFDSAEDSRALVAWLVKSQAGNVRYDFIHRILAKWSDSEIQEADWEELVMIGMITPMPESAEAAWRAIKASP